MAVILVVGATRGLGASIVKQYAEQGGNTVYGTTRSSEGPEDFPTDIIWLSGIDLMQPNVGETLVNLLNSSQPIDSLIITAGYFATEDLTVDKGPSWEQEQRMYTTSSIAPVFIVHQLIHQGFLKRNSKVVLVSSESGSITLRHAKEGGGNYAHHASKAALNMVGKLLSLDLREQGVIISIVHPDFMRTQLTKGVGFDKFWGEGGAVMPDKAATSLIEWTDKLDMSKTGQYWAPRGPGDIGTAEVVLGKNLVTPLQLPW